MHDADHAQQSTQKKKAGSTDVMLLINVHQRDLSWLRISTNNKKQKQKLQKKVGAKNKKCEKYHCPDDAEQNNPVEGS